MNCASCRHENSPSAKFCSECGTRLRAACPKCGIEVAPTAKFCQECGTALAAPAPAAALSMEEQFARFQEAMPTAIRRQLLTPEEGENRLVTVLFADMSRSVETTRDLHPEDAAELVNRLLKAMVDALMQFEGRIDKLLGDGVLAVFGAPQAHESDPERAIGAALAIREAARTLGLQITAGINTGEVYIGGMGSERHQEVTVMGPVVSLAARLQGAAEPGQVLVGEVTYRHTRRAFEFAPLSLEIKGYGGRVAAFGVERPLPRPEKARGIEGLRAELIGRDQEFAKLRQARDALLQGEGQVVCLIGEAGVGKSRLVAELKKVVASCQSPVVSEATGDWQLTTGNWQLLWLEGRCLELGMTAGYWPFLDIFREYLGWRPEDDEPARAGRLVTSLRDLVTGGELSEARFEEIGPLLGNVLSVRFGSDWDVRLKNAGPEEIRHRTFTAIRDFFVALSRRGPLLLVLEDLHWADSLSLDLIAHLMETVTLAPLFLLCVYRPEHEHKSHHLGAIAGRKCPERYTEITLRELSPAQSRRLIEGLLAIENLPERVKSAILAKSGGNPFFVEEVVRSLIDGGQVYQENGVWRAREGIERLSVPESIQGVIQSRIDRLEEELKRVLQSASVIGRLFRKRLLARVTRQETELERALWELEDRALVYQEQVVPEEEYAFKHALTQETVYQGMVRRRRAAFHRQVAEAIEAIYVDSLEAYYEPLAYHYERGGPDEKAIEYLLKAGEKARRAYLNQEAIGYFTRALERLQASEPKVGDEPSRLRTARRLEALTGLGRVFYLIGRDEEAERLLRQAITVGREIGLSVREMGRLYSLLGELLSWLSRQDEAVQVGEEGLAILEADTESVEAALMNSRVAIGSWHRGDWERWREFTLRNRRFLQGLTYSEELRPAYIHQTMLSNQIKRPEEAVQWMEALATRATQEHDLRGVASTNLFLGDSEAAQGDFLGALAHLQQGYQQFDKIGDTRHMHDALTELARIALSLGDLALAEEYLDRVLATAETLVTNITLVSSYLWTAEVRLCQGRWEEAAALCGKAVQTADELGLRWMVGNARHLLGRVCLRQGDRQEAARLFEEAVPPSGTWVPARALSGLEAACDDPEQFRARCARLREERSETPIAWWFLEPAHVGTDWSPVPVVDEPLAGSLAPDWVQVDPFGDSVFRTGEGLEIRAANGRNLWGINWSAPRVMRGIAGEFAAQAVCGLVSETEPAIGGLVLWKDRENFLRLDVGAGGEREITFMGSIGNEDRVIGRGRLPEARAGAAPGSSARVFLRLERLGSRVRALCSADGEEWFTAGEVEFPVADPVEVGVFAVGLIDRTIYPGAYPEGTAIRFEGFRLWERTQ